MKRFFSCLLIVLFVLSLTGCGNSVSDYTDFYYCNIEYPFGKDGSVIVSETRDITGHKGELSYLISLYLAGPSSKNLESPFPNNVKLVSAQVEENCTTIELSSFSRQLSDSEMVLACACLSLSAMEITGTEEVTIVSGEKNITMNKNDLLLFDTVTAAEVTEEAK